MTREEQRIKQIEQFASKCYEDGEKYSAFISGAIWADNNPDLSSLWHSASEEPEDGARIIMAYEVYGLIRARDFEVHYFKHYDWDMIVARYHIMQWALYNDLLPKGGVI